MPFADAAAVLGAGTHRGANAHTVPAASPAFWDITGADLSGASPWRDGATAGNMARVDWKVAATLAVTAALALAGYFATYWTNRRLAERAARLERVDLQLRDLYGPLLALVTATTRSWEAFRSRYKPEGGSYWDAARPPTEEEGETWRRWIQQVFMPLNEKMEQLVITKAELLDSPEMPKCLLDLVAHVEAYRVVIARWNAGDFREHKSLINFPRPDLLQYAEDRFAVLKNEQQKLLARRWR